ncbi:Wadjet anti-phage system protein JetD domain-containing protein [Corynebacterium aquilae]|uniref:Wadjet protein JetD C-terminal domain-containing protein n=1 Tax=Corynebacterium aquilae DSM 44791 TaxID=1431546 RepID=A0A1L7CDP9_9CORY|nr:DUF3322 and DUF2220 domain-containing protein [Corynebacterium aquilae]APT83992.1 hypothetical protein CAQU_01670 [Corynebacterium aquilae DSM 44791]
MKTVADVCEQVWRSYRNSYRDRVLGDDSPLSIALAVPTARQAIDNPQAVRDFIAHWSQDPLPGEVEWITKSLGHFGRTQLPARIRFRNSTDIATVASMSTAKDATSVAVCPTQFEQARSNVHRLREAFPDADIRKLRSCMASWARLDSKHLGSVITVAHWISENQSSISSMSERDLPVEGVDTKWFSHHRAVIEALVGKQTFGNTSRLIDLRSLDESISIAGFRRIGLAFEELSDPDFLLSCVPHPPQRIVVVENLASYHSLPAVPSTLAIFGAGYAARELALPWLSEVDVLYWGDIDTHGLNILSAFRVHAPHAQSVLMDIATARRWENLAVEETAPAPQAGAHLSMEESLLFDWLCDHPFPFRLEQERLPKDAVRTAFDRAIIP